MRSSVTGSSSSSVGARMPTQIVTIRPRESNMTDPQSAIFSVERTDIPLPSGPGPR